MFKARRIHFDPFDLDVVNECLWKDARAIKLRPKAFAVLEQLVSRAGELVTKDHLISTVWPDTFVGDAVLKVAVRQLRAALSDDPRTPRFIETAHRRGYRFIGQVSTRTPLPARPATDGADPARAESDRIDPTSTFVGREEALSRMHEWLEQVRAGESHVVFVTGEAGIGKTTLLETFARRIGSDHSVRICSGQCLAQYGMSEAYLPVLDAIGQLCHEDAQVVDVLRAHAPMWLMQMPSLVTPADRELFGRDVHGVTPDRMLREMGEVLDALTTHSVLVLALEDLHWSDFSTLDLISYLARRRRSSHLMVVGTYRPSDLLASRHPLKVVKQELASKHQCRELPLEYLTRETVAQHLAVRFPVNHFPPALASIIHERTEGSPLFMVNTIKHLISERLITPHDDGWRLTVPIETVQVGVPDSIRQLIETQVDRLEERDHRILEAASVAGAEFSALAVAAALDDDVAGAEARCEDLARRRQFITACGVQHLPDGTVSGRFAFLHAVYRHVLYDAVPPSRRMQLHRRLGLRGEELFGERSHEIAAELAMHFEQANDGERAAHYFQVAAVNALQRSAYREAIATSRRGLEQFGSLPGTNQHALQELTLLLTLGVPLIATEGYAASDVGSVYARARVLCERLDRPPDTSQVLWGLWTFHAVRAELPTALGLAAELLELADRVPDPDVAVRGHWAMGITSTHQGSFRLAHAHFEKALSLYDCGRDAGDPVVNALNPGVTMRCFAAWCSWFTGKADRALATIREAVTLARTLSEPHGLAHALAFAAVLHQFRREPSVARQYADEAVSLAAEHGLVFYGAMAQVVRGWSRLDEGDGERAAGQICQGLTAWQSTGARLMQPYFTVLLAEAHGSRGRQDEGLHLLEEALALGESTGERMYAAEVCRLRGERLLSAAPDSGELKTAQACFEQSIAIARQQDALTLELRAAMSLARLLRGRRGQIRPRDVLLPVYERFEEGFDTLDLRDARDLIDRDR